MSLSNSSDVDWYKWTNNTGKDKFIGTVLTPYNGGQSDYVLGHKIVYVNGMQSGLFYSQDSLGIENIYIPTGATLYLKVGAKVFISPSVVYCLYLVDHELD